MEPPVNLQGKGPIGVKTTSDDMHDHCHVCDRRIASHSSTCGCNAQRTPRCPPHHTFGAAWNTVRGVEMNIPMSPTVPPPSQKGGGRHLRSRTSWIPSRGRHIVRDESGVGLNPASIPNLHYSSASLASVK